MHTEFRGLDLSEGAIPQEDRGIASNGNSPASVEGENSVIPVIEDLPARKPRQKRFLRALPHSGVEINIPETWDCLSTQPLSAHDHVFVEILAEYELPCESPVPLVRRYSKARPWTLEELTACVRAHAKSIPVAIMSAALNRNPQDIIYRLLDECSDSDRGFRQVGLKSVAVLEEQKLAAGRKLFEAGLTAWRIAALFGADFEGVEKLLYSGRSDYGHAKKNPFGVCTDHKQLANKAVLSRLPKPNRILDAFAGEGHFAINASQVFPGSQVLCIESNSSTIIRGREQTKENPDIHWEHANNIEVMKRLIESGEKFELVDLDPFVSCRDQVPLVWKLLTAHAHLFITFGGEYRRSFIRTNRKAIASRYGYENAELSNQDYLEAIPSYFLGWVARQAAANGFILTLKYCVRYANNCRFWLSACSSDSKACGQWYSETVKENQSGFEWNQLMLPRFAQVRNRPIRIADEEIEMPIRKSRHLRGHIDPEQLTLKL